MFDKKALKVFTLVGAAAICFGGCQPTPQQEVISQKEDINAVVKDYAQDEDSLAGVPLKEQLGAPAAVSFEKVADGQITIKAKDAKVRLPQTDGIGAAVIRRADFSEAQVEAMAKAFFQGQTVYEDAPLTKEYYRISIEQLQKEYGKLQGSDASGVYLDSIQGQIDYLTDEMQSAPETVTPEVLDFRWIDADNVWGEGYGTITGTSRGESAEYLLSALKSESGSMISLVRNEIPNNFSAALHDRAWVTSNLPQADEGCFEVRSCTYDQEEALQLCMDFLEQCQMDTETLTVLRAEPLVEVIGYEGAWEIREGVAGYQFYIGHRIGDTPMTFARNHIMVFDSENEESQGRVPYDYEELCMVVDSQGIAEISWNNPMVVEEISAERVTLKPFDEILAIIEEQTVVSAQQLKEMVGGGDMPLEISITDITLGLMRVQNPGDENTYTLIPVWDVFCDVDNGFSLMTVNAMDGSIICRENGY